MVRCGLEYLVCSGDLVVVKSIIQEIKRGKCGVLWGPVFSPVRPVYSKHGISGCVRPSWCREQGQSKACLSEAPG